MMKPPSSIIEVAGLNHSYGERKVLQDLNLSIGKGEVFALIGPTGAGKTTLLRIVDLLEVPGAGEIYFDGKCIPRSGKQRLEIRRRMSFIHQKPQVFNLSVYDNVACGLRWRGEKKSRIAEKVDHILEMVGLEGHRNRNARTLSGGEAQRVALARSLVLEPEVLLLDEPTANLDPISTAKIEQLISYIGRQRNTTMVMATHDMPQGQQLADRIGVLLAGRLAQTGNATDIFRSPQNKEVAHFVGMENIIEGVIIANNEGIATVDIGGDAIQAVSNYPVGKKVNACVRPEDITLALSNTRSSARNSFQARVTQVTTLGPLSRVEIDCGFRLVALVTRISAEELNLQVGRDVYATFKATGVHIMERKASQ
ncbi:MAG TPA: ABC transporter ATP-binding protein [Dehalococcoidia bacterium]|nr:ABC transporter ATP-binding protein [Dehalococcoidia bacterium]